MGCVLKAFIGLDGISGELVVGGVCLVSRLSAFCWLLIQSEC